MVLFLGLLRADSRSYHNIDSKKNVRKFLVTPEFSAFPDIFQLMFFNEDRDEFWSDARGADKRFGKFADNSSFLISWQAFSGFQDYNWHSLIHRSSGIISENKYLV